MTHNVDINNLLKALDSVPSSDELTEIKEILSRLNNQQDIFKIIAGYKDKFKANWFGTSKEASNRIISYMLRGV